MLGNHRGLPLRASKIFVFLGHLMVGEVMSLLIYGFFARSLRYAKKIILTNPHALAGTTKNER